MAADGTASGGLGSVQPVFAFRRYEDASLSYTGIESHQGLTRYGIYDTVVVREQPGLAADE